jgi:hypothetical protein
MGEHAAASKTLLILYLQPFLGLLMVEVHACAVALLTYSKITIYSLPMREVRDGFVSREDDDSDLSLDRLQRVALSLWFVATQRGFYSYAK